MIHEDAIPFLLLVAVAAIAGFAGKKKEKNVGLVLFCLGGLLPLLSYISNAERLPIPPALEMAGFLSAIPLFLSGAYASKIKGNVFFWIAAAVAVIIAAMINLMIVGLLRTPV
tara:strand:- start:91 stop:429 length:339 start_codon:yes stop_codon:yes gene_type:complete